MMLVNYYPEWMNIHEYGPFSELLGDIEHPLYRRKFVAVDIHDERGNKIDVNHWDIMAVNRFHWNGNLQLYLTNDRKGYVSHDCPWRVECYSPEGELVRLITKDDCDK